MTKVRPGQLAPFATFLPKAALAALRRGILTHSCLPGGPMMRPRAWTSIELLSLRPTVVQLSPDLPPKARQRSFWQETAEARAPN